MFIDSHCHLDFPELATDQANVLARARNAGVVGIVNINTKRRDFEKTCATAQRYGEVFCSFGIHPHHVAEPGEGASTEEIINFAQAPKVVGLGETGLDYHYDFAPRTLQQEAFRRHIRAAKACDLPVIIHTREAEEDTLKIMKEEGPFKGVLHCFSSKRYLAKEGLKLGLYVSLSGILTFNKSQELRDIVRDLPMERLLIETDSPFLAPVPHRGKPCEPAYVARTAETLAKIKGLSAREVGEQTTANFLRLFTKFIPGDAE